MLPDATSLGFHRTTPLATSARITMEHDLGPGKTKSSHCLRDRTDVMFQKENIKHILVALQIPAPTHLRSRKKERKKKAQVSLRWRKHSAMILLSSATPIPSRLFRELSTACKGLGSLLKVLFWRVRELEQIATGIRLTYKQPSTTSTEILALAVAFNLLVLRDDGTGQE
jgi:hypothetical protein